MRTLTFTASLLLLAGAAFATPECNRNPGDWYNPDTGMCHAAAERTSGEETAIASDYSHRGASSEGGMQPVTHWFANQALQGLDPSTPSWKCTADGKRLPDDTPLSATVGICTGMPRY